MYKRLIIEATSCSEADAAEIENLMRDCIFHSTLDWQTREQLERAAREGQELLKQLRAEDPNWTTKG